MGYINKEFIDRLVEDIAILEDVIGDFVKLKRAGTNLKGLSPFNEEKTPSFVVSPVKGIWKDNSSGKGGKGPISFLMEKEGFSYPEAVEYIAKKYNEPIVYDKPEVAAQMAIKLEKKEELRKVLKLVHQQYFECYRKLDADHSAKIEVEKKRLYSSDTIIEWGIGFAPENFLYDKLKNSGYVELGKDLGLIKTGQHENIYDQYSNRVIYPIHDQNGLIIGLAGRDVSTKGAKAKWINPDVNAANVLYNKSKVWYGMHKARTAIRKKGEAWGVEGYNDVIAWHSYGLENTVAPCGTAITPLQIREIKKLCSKFIFAMDPDRAGKAAVLKQIPLFIAEGFRVEVVTLDVDPDDFSRKYADLIVLSGGLDEMFSAPGIRRDGFKILIDEFIKKDYLELEEKLIDAKHQLQQYADAHKERKAELLDKQNAIETDYNECNSKLKEIELEFGKKSEQYTQQHLTVSSLKKKLSDKKIEIKNLPIDVHHKMATKTVEKLTDDFNEAFAHSDVKRNDGARQICEVIASIEDSSLVETYTNWVQKESGVIKTTLNKWIKDYRAEREKSIEEIEVDYDVEYELPKEVKTPFSELEPVIKNYGMFMANNKIYMALPEGRDGKVYFSAISNFEISVLQHMNDEKFPTKLIRIKNVHNKEVIFDTLSENLNSPQAFYNTMSGNGNFNFKGDNKNLGTLRAYLFDNMGDGRKIEVLGWQPDGNFWAWNNRIITEDGVDVPLDKNGVFVQNEKYYYIASANKIYEHSSNKFNSQKRFRVIDNPIPFNNYMEKVMTVHREHAISGLLFGIASLFQDIAVEENGSFPILFLYGPGGSGKDELAYIIQSFTGIPQIPINLEGGASTLKAKIIELAQFKNGISQLSEYKRGDDKVDGTIKAIWDRVGYKRGSIESRIAIDTVDIESSVILTGNDYPNKEPIIIRTIWNEMTKTVFNQKEMQVFDELNDMTEKGLSGYSHRLLAYRKIYKENFSRQYRVWKGDLQALFPEAKGRIISNLSVLATTFAIFRDKSDIRFPFSQDDMIQHFRNQLELQMAKIKSADILVRFWDCFIASLRGHKDDRLQANYIVSVEETTLYIQWTHTMDKIERKWWTQYHELPPSRATFKEELKKAGVLIADIKVHSFDKGRDANRSSAVSINMSKLSEAVKDDIIGSVMYQINEGTLWDGNTKRDAEPTGQTAMPLPGFVEPDDDQPF